MKRQLQRFAIPTLALACGILIGLPTGYFSAATTAEIPTDSLANPDIIKLTLPKTFFADLPKNGNGDQRLVSVDTFNNAYLGAVVLPTFPQQPKSVGPLELSPLQR